MSEYIYGLRDPQTKEIRYVGWTRYPKRRLTGHIYDAKKGQRTHRSIWIRKLLRSDLQPEWVTLETDPVGGWAVAERAWIAYLKQLGCRLTNNSEGGEGSPGATWKLSEETKAKMRKPKSAETRARMRIAALRRAPLSPEDRARVNRRVSEAAKARPPMTEERRRVLSEQMRGERNPNYGRTHTPEARAKISAAAKLRGVGEAHPNYGRKHSAETVAKLRARVVSPETREKISAAAKLRTGSANPFYGKKHSPESRAKMSASHRRKGVMP